MQIEILAALVQVTQLTEERKSNLENLYTEDFNASEKIMNSIEDDQETLLERSSEFMDDAHHEELTQRH